MSVVGFILILLVLFKRKKTCWKDNETSGLGKGKDKVEEDIEEDSMMTEFERVARKKKDKELDEINALRHKLDAEDAEVKNLALILEDHKSFFLPKLFSGDKMKQSTIRISIGWCQQPHLTQIMI